LRPNVGGEHAGRARARKCATEPRPGERSEQHRFQKVHSLAAPFDVLASSLRCLVRTIERHSSCSLVWCGDVSAAKAERRVNEPRHRGKLKTRTRKRKSSVNEAVATTDSDIKGRVEASLKTDTRMDDINVSSVNNGVVLLSGKAANLNETLRAIENAYSVNGVQRVATEMRAIEN